MILAKENCTSFSSNPHHGSPYVVIFLLHAGPLVRAGVAHEKPNLIDLAMYPTLTNLFFAFVIPVFDKSWAHPSVVGKMLMHKLARENNVTLQ